MIKLANVTYSIPNSEAILKEINFEIKEGDFVGLLGKNGAGKTTLIDLIMGMRNPIAGSVNVLGKNPFFSDRQIFSEISFLSQDVWLKDNISVKDFFKFHSFFHHNYSIEDQEKLVARFKIDLNSKIGGLSTGQKRRVQITAAIASRPKILLIDEITAVLDPDARKIFFDMLVEINKTKNTTIVLATNIIEDLRERVKSILFINRGQVTSCSLDQLENLFDGDE